MSSTRDRNDDAVNPSSPFRSGAGAGEGHPDEEQGIELAVSDLSADALRGLVEEFVSREGTDYGHVDRSLDSKVRDVMRQLEDGDARIVFDLATETASIVSTRARR